MTLQPAASLTGLDRLWQETQGDPHVVIAVLDGPVDAGHACFQGARLLNCDCRRPVPAATGQGLATAHGTHVASTIVGQPGSPVAGVAPGCTVRICPVFADHGAGLRVCTQPDLARAIWSALRPPRGVALPMIINISGGELMPRCEGAHCPTAAGFAHPSLRTAIEECHRRGVLVVAAAGNDGCRCQHVPAALPGVLAVGALEERGPAPYSNYGPEYARQGVLAPGRAILGAVPGGGTIARDGTSFACGLVSGLAGLLLSLQRLRGQEPSPRAVRAALLRSRSKRVGKSGPHQDSIHPRPINPSGAVDFLFPARGASSMNDTSPERSIPVAGPPALAVPTTGVAAACACQGSVAAEDEASLFGTGPDEPEDFLEPSSRRRQERAAVAPRSRKGFWPSDCGCQRNGQLVYAIGELSFDFGSLTRQRSLQDAFGGAELNSLHVSDPVHLLMYLLGYRGQGSGGVREFCGHLNDAASVIWLLMQDDCPKYAIRPNGAFAEAGYLELIRFLFESLRVPPKKPYTDRDLSISTTCLDRYFKCHGGLECSLDSFDPQAPKEVDEAKTKKAAKAIEAVERMLGLEAQLPTRVAFAGRISGSVQLMSGETVSVIEPEMRGTSSWDTKELLNALPDSTLSRPDALTLVSRLVNRLYQEIRNDGLAPQERALNYGSTAVIRLLGAFLSDPDGPFARLVAKSLQDVAVDTVEVLPARCRRVESDPYDVEVSFFDFSDTIRGQTVLSLTIDVADVVPHLDSHRLYTRR